MNRENLMNGLQLLRTSTHTLKLTAALALAVVLSACSGGAATTQNPPPASGAQAELYRPCTGQC